MKVLLYFTRAYPSQSAIVLACLLLAGMLSAIGLSTALPLLSVITSVGEGVPAPTGYEARVLAVLATLGVPRALGPLLCVMVAAFVLKAVISLLANTRVGYTVAHVATDLRLRLLRALLAARWSHYTRLPVGRATNAMATEANRASLSYYQAAQALAHLVEAAVAACVALAVSWQATLLVAVAGVLSTSLLQVFVRMSSRAGHKQTLFLQSLLGRMTDALQAVKLLKTTGREALVGPLLQHDTKKLNRALKKQVVSKEALRTIQEPILVAFGGLGLWLAVEMLGMATSEAFLLILLFARTLNTVNKAQRKYQGMSVEESALFSILRTIEAAEQAREPTGGTRAPRLERGVELRDVSVEYEEQKVLRHLSVEIPAGEVTAIIGSSGAGKTTLVDLITGLTKPTSGELRVDDVRLDELDLHAWRQTIGYVPQEILVFHESVRNNVTLGDPSLDDAEVERALRDAGAWEFVSTFSEGLDTSVGERGSLLSGGQRQRLAIARALVHRPLLLVLDEATAALDAEAEAAVWATIASLRGKTTVVAISHQPALQGMADHIYRLEKGSATRLGAPPPEGAVGESDARPSG
jgi:ATP-binding cassette subfamily C protein